MSHWDRFANAAGTFQCTRCTTEHPETEGRLPFDFTPVRRFDAARAAIHLARRSSHVVLAELNLNDEEMNSARFMSLAYYAGGWPMIRQCSAGSFGAEGWYLENQTVPDKLEGSAVWRAHNLTPASDPRVKPDFPNDPAEDVKTGIDPTTIKLDGLVGFISGRTGSGGSMPRPSAITYTQSRKAVYVPIGKVLDYSGALDTADTPNASKMQAVFPLLQGFMAGDYVFIDSMDGNTLAEHGLLIVGFGPPVGPARLADSIYIDTWEFDSKGVWMQWMNQAVPTALGPYSDLQTFSVPYVVDWTKPKSDGSVGDRQCPRPFYFTRFLHDDWLFHHNYWLFVPAADRLDIRCDWLFAQNVAGDPNAPLLITTNEFGLYDAAHGYHP
jgi:hypothetical protein